MRRGLHLQKGLVRLARLHHRRRRGGNLAHDESERPRLEIVHNGGVFGEMALIDDEPRMANTNALTKTVCIVVPGDAFKMKLNAADPLIGALLRVFVENIRSTVAHKRASDKG
jgi:CRP-like cAMP-binding protein